MCGSGQSSFGGKPAATSYIAGKDGNLQVVATSECSAKIGDTIDVLGFPGLLDGRPSLLDSTCRIAPAGFEAEPGLRQAGEILTARMHNNPAADDFASGAHDDLNLVRVNGKLVLHSPGPDGDVLLLQLGSSQFIAVLPDASIGSRPKLENGSQLQVVGVCLVNYDRYRRAESFRILLRGGHDIVVLRPASWWNLQNTFRALFFTAVLLLAAILWVALQSIKYEGPTRC